MAKVSFDGPNKLIIVNNGITELDAKIDLYSDWKEWVLQNDNAKYLPAFLVIGGEPVGPGEYAGSTFFVINNWKLRPFEASHSLKIIGNIVGENGTDFIIPTIGSYTVSIQYKFSSLAQGVDTSGTPGPTLSDIVNGIWNAPTTNHTASGSFGAFIQSKLLTVAKFLGLK